MSFAARVLAGSPQGFAFNDPGPMLGTLATPPDTQRVFRMQIGPQLSSGIGREEVTMNVGNFAFTRSGPTAWHSDPSVIASDYEAKLNISSISGMNSAGFYIEIDPGDVGYFLLSDIPLETIWFPIPDTGSGLTRVNMFVQGQAATTGTVTILSGIWSIRHKASGAEISRAFTLRYN